MASIVNRAGLIFLKTKCGKNINLSNVAFLHSNDATIFGRKRDTTIFGRKRRYTLVSPPLIRIASHYDIDFSEKPEEYKLIEKFLQMGEKVLDERDIK